jgi:hypothetical protein
MPSGSYKDTDPKLVRDVSVSKAFHLAKGSVAIDAASGKYPKITTDMDGQARTAPFDAGADEVSNAPVTVRILNPEDVGSEVVEKK